MTTKLLKGEGFLNRYRIDGKLKTRSPLHVGTGEFKKMEDFDRNKKPSEAPEEKQGEESKDDKSAQVSLVARDYQDKPLIPGTALKGVMRHWLLHILSGVGADWAIDRNFNQDKYTDKNQQEQHDIIKKDFSWLEMLFGTPFNEGKVEVWDATCTTEAAEISEAFLNWDSDLLTYVTTSVAIDPVTGTAAEHLLYNNEVVPPGIEFDLTLVAQNVNDIELGLLLFALQGFNSKIYPIQVGARNGVGYGLLQYTPGAIHMLDKSNVKEWVKGLGGESEGELETTARAGYFALPTLSADRQNELIQKAKGALIDALPSENHV